MSVKRSTDGNFDFSGRSIVKVKVELKKVDCICSGRLYHCNTATPFGLKRKEAALSPSV